MAMMARRPPPRGSQGNLPHLRSSEEVLESSAHGFGFGRFLGHEHVVGVLLAGLAGEGRRHGEQALVAHIQRQGARALEVGDLGRVLVNDLRQLGQQGLGQRGGEHGLAQHDGHVHAEVALPHLGQSLAGLHLDDERADDAIVRLGQHRRGADSAQAVAGAPDVVGEIAAQGVCHHLGAGDGLAVLGLVVAHAGDNASLVVDGDDGFDADGLAIGHQLAQAVAHGIVQRAQFAGSARGSVQGVDDLAVDAQLGDVVDPAASVVLEHLLGGVLRAIHALALELFDVAIGRTGRHEGGGDRDSGQKAYQDEPNLGEEHGLLLPIPFPWRVPRLERWAPRPLRPRMSSAP